jgi:hypothetical protein
MKRKSKQEVIIIPGASGKVAIKMKEILQVAKVTDLFELTIPDALAWNTSKPHHPKNVQQVMDLVGGRNDYILVANSFGNRVVLEMLDKGLFPSGKTPSLVVVCGYPLWGPKENNDRVNLLRKSSLFSVRLCFVSGKSDEFLNRTYLSKKGSEALMQILETFKTVPDVHFIEKGKHSVPDCGGTRQEKQVEQAKFLDWFIRVCTQNNEPENA